MSNKRKLWVSPNFSTDRGPLGIRIVEDNRLPAGCAVMFDAQDVKRGETLEQAWMRQAQEGKAALLTGLDEASFE